MIAGMKRIYLFADFTLDVNEHRLLRESEEIYLQPRTFETLVYLIEHHGHLATKKELLDALWADTFVTENALSRCIKEVREALGDDAHEPRYIKTVPRVGYKFIAEVEEVGETVRTTDATEIERTSKPLPVSKNRRLLKVAALVLSLTVLGSFVYYIRHKDTTAPKPRTIAVLPFKPIAGAAR